MAYSTNSSLKFVVRKQICDLLNISRSTLWRIESRDSSFPRPINLNIRKAQWLVDEVMAWAASTRTGMADSNRIVPDNTHIGIADFSLSGQQAFAVSGLRGAR
ncbi:helix-turn-helix transcriptional regulator [Collimonas arenae]|uniref:helix-turn-helix transcriptional regulator n=1 Tax=Collimonas arenae TaxID=279058 RepID=UPI00056F5120